MPLEALQIDSENKKNMSMELQEKMDLDQHVIQMLTEAPLHYRFNYIDPILSMSIYPHTSECPGILVHHQGHVSVNGTALVSDTFPHHVQWYNEQRLFLHSYRPEKSGVVNTLKLIDIAMDKTIETIEIAPSDTNHIPTELDSCPCTACSREMQIFLVGGKNMQAIDIRSKKRLFPRHSTPVYAMALYSKSPYNMFYLAGHQCLSLFTMDLRNQKEIILFPKAIQLSKKLALEVCPDSKSGTLLYTIHSERLVTVVGHHKLGSDMTAGPNGTSTVFLMSRVAKHSSETFTWLHSMLCYGDNLMSPYLVCNKSGSRLALLNATDIESGCKSLSPSPHSYMASKNKSLNLISTISRACSAAATPGTLALAIDGGIYTASIS